MIRAVVAAAVLLLAARAAAAPVVELRAPRDHGWWIGDRLPVVADLTVDAALELDAASLPIPRSIAYWLDLRSVAVADLGVSDGRRRLRLTLVYQTFYAPLEPKRLVVPPVEVTFVGGDRRETAVLPPWSFVTAPIREILAPTAVEAIRPAPPVGVIDTVPTQLRAGLAGLVALAAGIGLAWHRGLGPFVRRDRPFSRAARQVRRHLAGGGAERESAALLALHRAFDAALGRRMLPRDVAALVAARPEIAPLAPAITAFFDASRTAFFAAPGSRPAGRMAAPALTRLADDLAALERRRP